MELQKMAVGRRKQSLITAGSVVLSLWSASFAWSTLCGHDPRARSTLCFIYEHDPASGTSTPMSAPGTRGDSW